MPWTNLTLKSKFDAKMSLILRRPAASVAGPQRAPARADATGVDPL
jgi:hypothetical protein